jgi:hypothetical protein
MEYIGNFITESINEAIDQHRANKAAARHDGKLIQDLQRSILTTTNYLADPYIGTQLIARNTDPKLIISAMVYSCRKSRGFLVYCHTFLPKDLHPMLNRLYAPSRSFISDQKLQPEDQHVQEQIRWVGFDMKDFLFKRPDDFFNVFEDMLDEGGAIITCYPNRLDLPRRAFLMEMRGYFRDDNDVLVAAKRHIDVVEKLVKYDYLVLEDDVIAPPGWSASEELDARVIYA